MQCLLINIKRSQDSPSSNLERVLLSILAAPFLFLQLFMEFTLETKIVLWCDLCNFPYFYGQTLPFSVKTQEPLKPSALSGKPVCNSHQVFSLWSTALFLAHFHFVLYVYKLWQVLEKKEHRSQTCLVCSYLTGVYTIAVICCIKTLTVDEVPCQI